MSYQPGDCFILFHVNIIPIKGYAEVWLLLSYESRRSKWDAIVTSNNQSIRWEGRTVLTPGRLEEENEEEEHWESLRGGWFIWISTLYLPVLKPSFLRTVIPPQNNVGGVHSLCAVFGSWFPRPYLNERRDGSRFSSGWSGLCDLRLDFEK